MSYTYSPSMYDTISSATGYSTSTSNYIYYHVSPYGSSGTTNNYVTYNSYSVYDSTGGQTITFYDTTGGTGSYMVRGTWSPPPEYKKRGFSVIGKQRAVKKSWMGWWKGSIEEPLPPILTRKVLNLEPA